MIKWPFMFILVAAALSYVAIASSPAFAQQHNNKPAFVQQHNNKPAFAQQHNNKPKYSKKPKYSTKYSPPPPERRIVGLMRQRQHLIDRCERWYDRGKDLKNIPAQLRKNERKLVRFGASPIAPAPSYCSETT